MAPLSLSIILFLLCLSLTKNEIEIGLSYRNTSINVLKHNTTIEHNSMFNISNLLSASSCTCEYHMSNYVESPNQNFSNFYIQMNNTKEEIKNAKLTSNNENYNSFYNLNKVNESYYNLTIMTQCQKTKQMKAKVDDYTKGNYLPIKTNKNLNNNEHYIMMNFSFEHNNTEYNFEYVKICKYENESLAIGSSIIMLFIAFLYMFLSTYIHIDLKEIKEINEMTEIPWWYGFFFVIVGSGVLLLIFFFFEYINYILQGLVFFQSFICLYYPIKYYLKLILKKVNPELIKKVICTVKIYDIVSLVSSFGLVVIYFATRYWFMNNIIAFGLCFTILSLILMKSFRTCFVFLFSVFVYDTFWVFYSNKVFTGNVMEAAATRLILPIKIEMIVLFSQNPMKNCLLLGLGDIVIPGMVVKYCHRLDKYSIKNKGKGGYFKLSLILYLISVCLAEIMMFVFSHGQPVLFYISPIFIVGLMVKAYCNKELGDFWKGGKKKEKTKEEEKEMTVEKTVEMNEKSSIEEYKKVKNEEDEKENNK